MDKDSTINEFINNTQTMESGALGELQRAAYLNGLPIIPPETARFLRVLITMNQPLRVLEIGCAVGFSACLMAEYMPENGTITTIDRFQYMIDNARDNIRKLNKSDKITLLEGDAAEILPLLNAPFDFIFMDAAKAQYLQFLPECIRLLRKGGILVCDDVLQNGMVSKNRFSVPRRQRTIHRRMRAFLWLLSNTEGLESSILTIGDGLTVTIKTCETVEFKEIHINEF